MWLFVCVQIRTYIHTHTNTHTHAHTQTVSSVAYVKLISPRGNANWKLHQNKIGEVRVAKIIKMNETVVLLAWGHPASAAVLSQPYWLISSPPRTATLWSVNEFLFGICPHVVGHSKCCSAKQMQRIIFLGLTQRHSWLTSFFVRNVILCTIHSI